MQNYDTTPGSVVWAYSPCHPSGGNPAKNEAWSLNANGTITELESGLCLDLLDGIVMNGNNIVINTCNGAATQQVQLVVPSFAGSRD